MCKCMCTFSKEYLKMKGELKGKEGCSSNKQWVGDYNKD